MANLIKLPRKNTLIFLTVGLSIIPLLAVMLWSLGIVFTYTGSMPTGFYRIVDNYKSVRRGSIISFCIPDKIAVMGIDRGYIKHGACQNGSEELIKQVIAIPGDMVTVTRNSIVVNGSDAMHYDTPLIPRDKMSLPVFKFVKNGTYIAKGYWVYGCGDSRYSWDSRYYGEIPKHDMTHRLEPLWLF